MLAKTIQEIDSESTDDGFDRFTHHQVHLSTSRQWLCLLRMMSGFFLLLIEIISIPKFFIIVHFFVLNHEKQTLSYIQTKFEGDKKNKFFFFQFLLWEHPFSATTLKITWAREVDVPKITWYE